MKHKIMIDAPHFEPQLHWMMAHFDLNDNI